jgi:hypothetical protein
MHPVTQEPVVCTEPSPDVAKALSTASQITAKGGTPQTSGELGFAGGSAEAVSELAGRSTALLALRDGLYHTCEAYANGALGADAYALVLARYGQLMTTLFLGQDIAEAGRTASTAPTSMSSPEVSLNFAGGAQPSAPATGQTSGSASGAHGAGNQPLKKAADPTDTQLVLTGAANKKKPGNTPDGKAAPGQTTDQTAPERKVPQPEGGAQAASAVAAAGLVRLNQDYFDLDRDLVQLLLVACINDRDPTRLRHEEPNPWLKPLCGQFDSLAAIQEAADHFGDLQKRTGHPGAPVDLTAVIVAAQAKKPESGSAEEGSAAPQPRKTDVRLAQVALKADNYRIPKMTGELDSSTQKAIRQYQTDRGMAATGTLDPQTFENLLLDVQKRLIPPAH